MKIPLIERKSEFIFFITMAVFHMCTCLYFFYFGLLNLNHQNPETRIGAVLSMMFAGIILFMMILVIFAAISVKKGKSFASPLGLFASLVCFVFLPFPYLVLFLLYAMFFLIKRYIPLPKAKRSGSPNTEDFNN